VERGKLGTKRVNDARIEDAISVGAQTMAVGCPFCLAMLQDAAKSAADRGKGYRRTCGIKNYRTR